MPRTRTLRRVAVATLIGAALVVGVAQVAPGLVIFSAGDPIETDVLNHNFAVLDGRIDAVSADADLTAYFGTTDFGGDGREPVDCVLGDVRLSAALFGYGMVADGRLLSIAEHTALFSLLSTQYGGDGRTTFALPDLRDVAPKSRNGQALNYYVCTRGDYPARN